jgi:ATP-dependent exoDNAse (exonuclease V) alpha subunit
VERGLLSIAKNRTQAIEQLVTDWAQDEASHPQRALIFCGTNKEVEIINDLCQKHRLRSRQLDAEKCIRFGDGEFFVGDRVRMTENSRPIGVENGDLGTISRKVGVRNTITVAMDDGRTVVVPLSSYPHVRLGYAVTTHSGQGTTVENAYALVGGFMQHRQLSYTQASRAKGRTRFYTDEHEAGPKLTNLARQMRESREKHLATDLSFRQHEHELEIER